MNKSSLLSQLQIDRSDGGGREPDQAFPWWILGAAAAVLALAALAWFLVARPDRPAVRVAQAVASTGGASASGGSLLDASALRAT